MEQASVVGAPRVPAFAVDRPRLWQRLDAPAPVRIVRAPAGSGKTTLLASWVGRASDRPRVWVSVDESTGDRAGFWAEVADALRELGIAVDDDPRPPDGPPRRELRRMLAAAPDGLVLVVDDLDRAEPAVAEDLLWLVERAPRLELAVSCRSAGPLESIAARARIEPALLEDAELLFTDTELAEVLTAAGADPALAPALGEATGAVPLLARAVATDLARTRILADPAGQAAVIRRLADATVHDLIADACDAGVDRLQLLALSVPEHVTAPLARRLTAVDDPEALISEIARAGLGAVTRDAGEWRLALTPVVREALGTEFAARLPRERERAQRVTAEWLYDTGDGFGAFALAVRAGDYDYAARVTRTELFELLGEHGRDVLLLLQPVSRLTLRRYPLLTLMLALISNARGHRVRAAEYFALTTIGARAARKTADPEERIVLLAVESASLRVAGRIGPAMRAARAFEAAVDEIPVERFERLAPIAPALFAHVGITLLYGGAGDDALAAFERAHSFSVPGSDFELQPLALLAGTHAIRGELDRARALVARIRSGVWRGDAINGYRGAFLHLAEAIIGVDEADFTGARDRLQVMAPHLDTLEHWPLFAWVLALCDLGLGVPAHSDVVLKRELRDRRRASITSLTGMVLLATRANLLLASGQATEATAVLASAASTPITRPASARVALLAGDAERTITELAPLEADALPPRTAAEVQLLVAAASLRLGREDAARSAAESAAAILVTSGLRHPLSLLPREDRDDLAALLTPTARELLGDAGVPELFPRRVSVVALTARERAVLERLAQGGTLPEIAAELHVSVNTLKTQLRSVYRKLGAGDRESALAAAQGHGLLGG